MTNIIRCITGFAVLAALGGCACPFAGGNAYGQPLFDGKTMGHWEVTKFGGEGPVTIEDGKLQMAMGNNMTGVTWKGEPPARIDYEIEFDAQRTLGNDFFVGLTFPVRDKNLTLIVGGWGGAVVGLSSLDGYDASENLTTQVMTFDNNHWYHVRLSVTDAKVQVWIDNDSVIDCPLEGHRLDTRIEVELSRPLGFATWNSAAELRNIRWKKIPPP